MSINTIDEIDEKIKNLYLEIASVYNRSKLKYALSIIFSKFAMVNQD